MREVFEFISKSSERSLNLKDGLYSGLGFIFFSLNNLVATLGVSGRGDPMFDDASEFAGETLNIETSEGVSTDFERMSNKHLRGVLASILGLIHDNTLEQLGGFLLIHVLASKPANGNVNYSSSSIQVS